LNFIQLVKRLRQEVGASGSDSTVDNAAGEWKRLVDWVSTAWVDIQEDEAEWDFMRGSFSFSTIPGQQDYAPDGAPLNLTDFRRWMNNTFRIQQTGPGDEMFLTQMPFDLFRDVYKFGSYRDVEAVPYAISVHPNKSLLLGPKPLGVYTILGEYYKVPQVLELDSDTPNFPERYHMMIVYRAMMSCGMYEAAEEVLGRAKQEHTRMMDIMRPDQLQPVSVNRRFL
jgi:hypothetical protein